MNRLNVNENVLTLTASTTLGYGPNQQIPASLILVNGSGAVTVTLPPILSSQATTLPGEVTEGTGPIEITVRNVANYALTLAAASGDSINDTQYLGKAGASVTLRANPADRKWYRVNAYPLAFRTLATGATLAATDRIVSIADAGTTRTPPIAGVEVGRPLVIHNVAASQTITCPATETVTYNGAAAITLGAYGKCTLVSDGSNWLQIA